MTAPKVRHWYDANAPVLTSALGSINNVLDKVLVDGYDSGNFPALGWTKEYEDAVNHKTAFRNSVANGTGAYIQVQQHHASYTYQQDMTVRMFETMSDVDTGVGPFQNEDRKMKASASNIITNTIPWVIIGDDRRFHLFVFVYAYNVADVAALRLHAQGKHCAHGFLGDCIKLRPTDSFCSIIGVYSSSSYNCFLALHTIFGNNTPTSYSTLHPNFPRKIDGTVIPTAVSLLTMMVSTTGHSTYPSYPHLGDLNLFKTYLNVGQHDTGSASGTCRSRRATIPGWRAVFHKHSDFDQLEEISNGSTYLMVLLANIATSVANSVVAIDIGTSWDEE